MNEKLGKDDEKKPEAAAEEKPKEEAPAAEAKEEKKEEAKEAPKQAAVQMVRGLVEDNSMASMYAQKPRHEYDMEDVGAMSIDGSRVNLATLPEISSSAAEDDDMKF